MPVQRQLHSFLFADLVGFTALTATRGDVAGAEVALTLQHTARELAAECGAEFVKAMGDEVMVRGHDAGDTVCHGLRLAAALIAHPSRQLIRVGVHTGPAIGRANDWYGTTVNVAARLAAYARGGEVLVSDGTARNIAGARELELVERGPWRPRGAPTPIQVFVARSTEVRESGLVAIAV
jgi:adenylate cyclase